MCCWCRCVAGQHLVLLLLRPGAGLDGSRPSSPTTCSAPRPPSGWTIGAGLHARQWHHFAFRRGAAMPHAASACIASGWCRACGSSPGPAIAGSSRTRPSSEIVDSVLGDYGISHKEWRLNGEHPKRDYCVQYRETAYDFICRLLEEEGIFFYFRHDDEKPHCGVHRQQPRPGEVRQHAGRDLAGRRRDWAASGSGRTPTGSAPANGRSATTTSRRPRPT